MNVTVITPTIGPREELLGQAIDSVNAQTVPVRHAIICDVLRSGPAALRTLAVEHAGTELVAFLDDDDLLDPDHIETLLAAMPGVDLVFSWHRRVGDAPLVPRFDAWCDEAWGMMLGGRNVIPVTVLARREVILDAGGFDPADRYEDYSLWLRMIALGARVACVPRETWTYRQLGENRTWL